MKKRAKGMTVTYWHNGNKVREYHDDAVRAGCRLYTGEQFDVLLNQEGQVIASYKPDAVIGVEDHNLTDLG